MEMEGGCYDFLSAKFMRKNRLIQGISGCALNYGTLKVNGTGGTENYFSCISNSLEFKKAIQVQIQQD
ncbi:MAG: hypothetical protein AAGU27_13030 [Dehalobacterium sp.]